MRLSKQLFASKMNKPRDFETRKTSSILEEGVFTYFRDPGIPFYLPIGKKILNNLQKVLLEEASNLDINHIDIPVIMRDEVLNEGEEIKDAFNERILKIKNINMEGYHLLTTPEPMLLDLATISLTSHNQLPIRFVYNSDVVRGVRKPKGMLRGRQFKTFMGNSFDKDKISLEKSLKLFEQLSDNIFKRLRIDVHKRRNQGEINIEHFYMSNEGDNLIMPEIEHEKRVKALSLSMAYNYNPKKGLKARFRNKRNRNSIVHYSTFGLGTQRTFYAMIDASRDKKGFNIPVEINPFKYSLIPLKRSDAKSVERVYAQICGDVMFDDRKNPTFGEKVEFSDFIGIPWKIICDDGNYTLKSRDGLTVKKVDSIEKLFKSVN